ncbi:hypothetical protein, partial [Rhodopirellula halodulae]|uniref:hypothetical protein n=1 Tax=Rhodopirellula halodulae TaxID=2894198 RepID=UPI001E51B152
FGCHRSSHTPLLRGAQSIAFIRLSANTSFRIGSKRAIVAAVTAAVALFATFVTTSRKSEAIKWIPYTSAAVAENELKGRPSAVLFYARWALSMDPKGGLATPAIHQCLADAGYVSMEADLTNSGSRDFDKLNEQGFRSIPILVLYPIAGPRLVFDGGTPESEIVAALTRPSQ